MELKKNKMQITLICIFLFLLMIPVTAMVPVLKQITERFSDTISLFEKHLFMSVNMIAAMIFAPIMGLLSDKYKKRKSLVFYSFLLNGICLLLFTLDFTYYQFLMIRFFEGCFHISSLTLLMTMAVDRVKYENNNALMGAVGSSISLGVAFGAPFGGLIGNSNYVNVFYFGSIILFISAFFIKINLNEFQKKSKIISFKHILQILSKKQKLIIPYFFTFIDRISVGFIISTLVLYLSLELKASPKEIGFIMAIFLIPFSLLIYPASKLSMKKNKLLFMILGSLLYGILLITLAHLNLDEIKIAMFFAGIVSAFMYAPSLLMVSEYSGEDDKAAAMSGFNSAGSLGFLIGPLFGGLIINQFMNFFNTTNSYLPAFYFIGILEILCALIFIPFILYKKR